MNMLIIRMMNSCTDDTCILLISRISDKSTGETDGSSAGRRFSNCAIFASRYIICVADAGKAKSGPSHLIMR